MNAGTYLQSARIVKTKNTHGTDYSVPQVLCNNLSQEKILSTDNSI